MLGLGFVAVAAKQVGEPERRVGLLLIGAELKDAAGVLRNADDDEVRIIDVFVDTLSHGQVRLAS